MPYEAAGYANGIARAPGSIMNVHMTGSQSGRRSKFSEFITSQDDAWGMEEETPVAVAQTSGHINKQRPATRASSEPVGKSASTGAAPETAGAVLLTQVGRSGKSIPSVDTGRKPGTTQPKPPLQASSSAGELSDEKQSLTLKFSKLLQEPRLNIDKLRDLSWHGIPRTLRPQVWQLLSGYVPPVPPDKRAEYRRKKRREYHGLVTQYYGSRLDEKYKAIFHQIVIDVPRTNPSLPQFQEKQCQEVFERILYIWALRHPGSSYVQGMNDLVTPFVNTFLEESTGRRVSDINFANIDAEILRNSEADAFWCVSKLLDGVQDNYTMAQKGIQRKVMALADLVSRIDKPLHEHLQEQNIPFMHFSFRWMNCLLMRELPLSCAVRMFDTYLAEVDGFASFHLYVCAAFLKSWSKRICATDDFTELLTLLQNLPTDDWTDKDIGMVLSEAFVWKHKFHGSRDVAFGAR